MAKRPANRIDDLKRKAAAEGYELKRRAPWIKHSFEVDPALRDEMKRVSKQMYMRLKDAVDAAFREWLERQARPKG